MIGGLLLVEEALLARDPTAPALAERLRLRQVPLEALAVTPHHRPLLAALARTAADPAQTWAVVTDPAWILPATTAGLAGVVLIGAAVPPGDHGVVVAEADSLADTTRVMIPRRGGCWHDPR
jgi:hypothetical protein